MIVKYLASAPKGDIPLGPGELATPFKLTPSDNHAFLTLGDYFKAINDLVLRHLERCAIPPFKDQGITPDRIREVLIRTEKHGAFYHLASVEIRFDTKSIKLAVSTAVSEEGKALLGTEFDTLGILERDLGLPYLPRSYLKDEMEYHAGTKRESFLMLLSEWFEGYHEWHLSLDKEAGAQRVCIWDAEKGYRFASREEGLDIYRQSSKILTLFYNTRDFRQIYPWHHAAGDFVVGERDGSLDVKLTTARNYQAVMISSPGESLNPMIALVYFFLGLTVKMRLDKLDGVGKTVWAGDYAVAGTIQGFLEAIRAMEINGRYGLGRAEDFMSLLKGFDRRELKGLVISMLEFYRQEDPADVPVIQANLEAHVDATRQVIQNLSKCSTLAV